MQLESAPLCALVFISIRLAITKFKNIYYERYPSGISLKRKECVYWIIEEDLFHSKTGCKKFCNKSRFREFWIDNSWNSRQKSIPGIPKKKLFHGKVNSWNFVELNVRTSCESYHWRNITTFKKTWSVWNILPEALFKNEIFEKVDKKKKHFKSRYQKAKRQQAKAIKSIPDGRFGSSKIPGTARRAKSKL